jgi:hypothetical protein
MPKDPCPPKVSKVAGVPEKDAALILDKLRRAATERAKRDGTTLDHALREIAGEMKKTEELVAQIKKRNILLDIKARKNITGYVSKFPTIGEGLLAFLEGTQKVREGGRLSVDLQSHSIHGKYIGRLVAGLEKEGLLGDFRSGKLSRDIYTEMEQLSLEEGIPGSSGSPEAMKIAKILNDITDEMVSRQNRAGAYISKVPGYVIRQTHDVGEIRKAGGLGPGQKKKSYAAWQAFVMPLLDPEKTYAGRDPELFLRNVHDALYSGIHGEIPDEVIISGIRANPSISASKDNTVLHFKDADSAWKYNQKFGIRDLKAQIFSDIFYRSRSIALMENMGPSGVANWESTIRELQLIAREGPESAAQSDSLRTWKLQAALDTVTGKSDIPVNFTLARNVNVARSLTILSKMGGVVISSLSDKVFMNSELAHQGLGMIDRWIGQLRQFAIRSDDEKRTLRLMGVALDGVVGNTVSRYTMHSTMTGAMHALQQKMFDLNFLNWWTDSNKAAAAELMSAHLGEHAGMTHAELPHELSRLLSLYDITPARWDAIRSTAYFKEAPDYRNVEVVNRHDDENTTKIITPDQLRNVPDETIDKLLGDQKPTVANRLRERDRLDTQLRAYYRDRVDIAVPTPGAAEKKYATWGGMRPGTPWGEAARLIMMFKSFPITIMTRVLGREVYGSGSDTLGHWLMNDHRGKFHTAQLIAMLTIAGYMSSAIRDALKGRTPRRLVEDDGTINYSTLQDAAARGGGLGIMGDYLLNDYDRGYRNALSQAAGPVLGQIDPLADAFTRAKRGEFDSALDKTGKLALDNTPFINLFYMRPALDYLIFWNMQEAMTPGSLKRLEHAVEQKNHQGFFLPPSEVVGR